MSNPKPNTSTAPLTALRSGVARAQKWIKAGQLESASLALAKGEYSSWVIQVERCDQDVKAETLKAEGAAGNAKAQAEVRVAKAKAKLAQAKAKTKEAAKALEAAKAAKKSGP